MEKPVKKALSREKIEGPKQKIIDNHFVSEYKKTGIFMDPNVVECSIVQRH